jgi:hypothetical protein
MTGIECMSQRILFLSNSATYGMTLVSKLPDYEKRMAGNLL